MVVLISLAGYGVIKLVFSPGKYDDFAICLAENGAKMYGTDWCSHCKDQKLLFGKSFKYVDYTDCDLNKDACTLCGACDIECASGVKLRNEIEKARERMVKDGNETEANKKMIENIRAHNNPFGEVKKGEKPKELYCC